MKCRVRSQYLFISKRKRSGAAGARRSRRDLRRDEIVGVQASGAVPSRSWRGDQRVTAERVNTFAEGMAARST